jgi:hypothetical protein
VKANARRRSNLTLGRHFASQSDRVINEFSAFEPVLKMGTVPAVPPFWGVTRVCAGASSVPVARWLSA